MITKFKYMIVLVFLLSIFIFTSCQHELEHPSWEVDITAPLLHTQLDINDLMIDSNLTINNKKDSSIILVYQYPITNIELDEDLNET